jgi:hypothetical protein
MADKDKNKGLRVVPESIQFLQEFQKAMAHCVKELSEQGRRIMLLEARTTAHELDLDKFINTREENSQAVTTDKLTALQGQVIELSKANDSLRLTMSDMLDQLPDMVKLCIEEQAEIREKS